MKTEAIEVKMPDIINREEEREKIKKANDQSLRDFLLAGGFDADKIPRIEWDKLLRIMKKDSTLAELHNALMQELNEIIAPYKLPPPTPTGHNVDNILRSPATPGV